MAAKLIDVAIEIVKEKDMWKKVDFMMRLLYKESPYGMRELEKEVAEKKAKLFKETGASKSGEMRDLAAVPLPVARIIKKYYDKDEELGLLKAYREFAKRYPKLCIANKI